MIDLNEKIVIREYYELNKNCKLPEEIPELNIDIGDILAQQLAVTDIQKNLEDSLIFENELAGPHNVVIKESQEIGMEISIKEMSRNRNLINGLNVPVH